VEITLLKKALGYTYKETVSTNVKGKLKNVRLTKRVLPDMTAIIFWLTNREPERWKHKREQEKGDRPIDDVPFDFSWMSEDEYLRFRAILDRSYAESNPRKGSAKRERKRRQGTSRRTSKGIH
jgi:hypothetical protein